MSKPDAATKDAIDKAVFNVLANMTEEEDAKKEVKAIAKLAILELDAKDARWKDITTHHLVTTNPLYAQIYHTIRNFRMKDHRLADDLDAMRLTGERNIKADDTKSEKDDEVQNPPQNTPAD